MDQLNLFKRVAHVWIVPNVVQSPAAAYADNLLIDPAIFAGHGVYHQAGSQHSGEESWLVQTWDHKTVALYDSQQRTL